MTGFCWPQQPTFESGAEREVWLVLKSQLRDGDALLHGIRFTDDENHDRELDLVVLRPDQGVAVIEVKGGHVAYADGRWTSSGGRRSSRIRPVQQAREGWYALRDYVTGNPRWSRGRLPGSWLLALPHTHVSTDLSPDVPAWKVVDDERMASATDLVAGVLARRPDQDPPPPGDWVESVLDILIGRGEKQVDIVDLTRTRDTIVERLTADQASVLDLLAGNQRLEVVGTAGSGKTWLAFEQARRWAAEGLDVALVCYGRGLATYLTRRAASLSKGRRIRTVSTYHQLGVSWGVSARDESDQAFWVERMPALMMDAVADLPDAMRYDALVVDEAQDFADSWWPPLLAALHDPAEARIAVFRDDSQAVFGRRGTPGLEGAARVTLTDNLRNSREIADAFRPLAGGAFTCAGGSGLPVRHVTVEPGGDVYGAASDIADQLLADGWRTDQVALLTTKHRHPVHREQRESGQDSYWAEFWDGTDIFYGTVNGFKGLERPAVVLAVDGFHGDDRADETMYVGMSRARDLLVVVMEEQGHHATSSAR